MAKFESSDSPPERPQSSDEIYGSLLALRPNPDENGDVEREQWGAYFMDAVPLLLDANSLRVKLTSSDSKGLQRVRTLCNALDDRLLGEWQAISDFMDGTTGTPNLGRYARLAMENWLFDSGFDRERYYLGFLGSDLYVVDKERFKISFPDMQLPRHTLDWTWRRD